MWIFLWIIVAFVIFSVIVLVHEWGHFKSARIFWVKVEEFGLWIPPRAKKLFTDKKWTIFSLNWLPLWGFVKLTWEAPKTFLLYDKDKKFLDNEALEKYISEKKDIFDKFWDKIFEEDKKEILRILEENKADYNLTNKPAWQQSIIILAWIFMNFVLAFLIFFILFMVWVKPIWINTKIPTNLEVKLIPTISQAIEKWILEKKDWIRISPAKWSLAQKSWLNKDDVILEVNWQKVNTNQEFLSILWENKSKEITIKRTCETDCNQNISIKLWQDWKIWAFIWENIIFNENFKYKYWPLDSAKYAFLETKNQVLLTFKWMWFLLKNIISPQTKEQRTEAIQSVSWPVWIVSFITNTLSAGFIFLLIIWAIISISIWVFNLLPIPALDWWRFLFIVLNAFFKKIFWKSLFSSNLEIIINFSFIILLFWLFILVTYNDIAKLIW